MLQKLNSRRGGFTLVEIMIVVAIIALLASVAVPNFMRARVRTQATQCKQDLRILDAAIDQWAIENNKANGVTPTAENLKAYVKENTAMYIALAAGSAKDSLGSTIVIPAVGSPVAVPEATKTATADLVAPDFWSPYQ